MCFWGYQLDKLTFHARLAFINWRENPSLSIFYGLLHVEQVCIKLHDADWVTVVSVSLHQK